MKEKVACRWCGREFVKAGLHFHEVVCPKKVEVEVKTSEESVLRTRDERLDKIVPVIVGIVVKVLRQTGLHRHRQDFIDDIQRAMGEAKN